jgi:O-antigen chain-terminating methyltransferase
MIEENNHEIDVAELMQKIREEVAKRGDYSPLRRPTSKPKVSNTMTVFQPILAFMEGLLRNAELRAEVRTKWPDNLNKFPFNLSKKIQNIPLKILNFIFKDQREVNFNLIRALKESIVLNRQLIEQVTSLRNQLDELSGDIDLRFKEIYKQLDVVVNEGLSTVNSHLQGVDEGLSTVNSRLQGVDEGLSTVNSRLQGVDEGLSTVNSHFQGVDERLNTVNSYLQRVDERHLRNDSYLKNDLAQQKRLITMFLEEARRRLPEPFDQEQLQTFVNEEQHLLDAFYVALEDHFRGSREEIKNRLTTYIPFVKKVLASTEKAGIIDIGCGRGEWLELLYTHGFKSSGIDINCTMVERCQALSLDAIEGDGLSYLRAQEDNSLAIISAFHVIEHLPLQELICLIEEALRVLCLGGIVIFETPNPENLIVGACNFYLDPTHRNPIPPKAAQFLLENRGFSNVEILNLQPIVNDHGLENAFLKNLLLSSQDYAVIGWKQ